MEEKFIIVYVIFKNKEEAISISNVLIEKKLIACANIAPSITSMYRWNGEIVTDEETPVIYKTRESIFEKIKEEISKLHSYSIPCIISIPLENGNEAYFKWILENTLI